MQVIFLFGSDTLVARCNWNTVLPPVENRNYLLYIELEKLSFVHTLCAFGYRTTIVSWN